MLENIRISPDSLAGLVSHYEKDIKNIYKKGRNNLRVRLKKQYLNYLLQVISEYSKAKTLFSQDEGEYIYDFYAPLNLKVSDEVFETPGISDLIKKGNFSIITAHGGSGKTVFMKHLLLGSLKESDKVPIFVELRKHDFKEKDLQDVLLHMLTLNGLEVDHDYLQKALEFGHFCILLDGYDELNQTVREGIANQIRELASRYPDNYLIVSSRPDDHLNGWDNFIQYHVASLDLDTAVKLIERLPAQLEDIKRPFIEDLKASLFDKHQSFLSNPLLLTLMLLTYREYGQIPGKITEFYQQAYYVLFQKHDALKQRFQRPRVSNLDMQDFSRVFSAFCLLTYDDSAFTFISPKAIEYLDQAKNIAKVENYESSCVLEDAIQAVSLLMKDGLYLTFVHRSFQEFFVAEFIRHQKDITKKYLINRFVKDSGRIAVLKLYYELDKDFVEENLFIPEIRSFLEEIGYSGKLGKRVYLRYLRTLYTFLESGPFRFKDKDEISVGLSRKSRPKLNTTMRLIESDTKFREILKLLNEKEARDSIFSYVEKENGFFYIKTDDLRMKDDLFNLFYRTESPFSPVKLLALVKYYEEMVLSNQRPSIITVLSAKD